MNNTSPHQGKTPTGRQRAKMLAVFVMTLARAALAQQTPGPFAAAEQQVPVPPAAASPSPAPPEAEQAARLMELIAELKKIQTANAEVNDGIAKSLKQIAASAKKLNKEKKPSEEEKFELEKWSTGASVSGTFFAFITLWFAWRISNRVSKRQDTRESLGALLAAHSHQLDLTKRKLDTLLRDAELPVTEQDFDAGSLNRLEESFKKRISGEKNHALVVELLKQWREHGQEIDDTLSKMKELAKKDGFSV